MVSLVSDVVPVAIDPVPVDPVHVVCAFLYKTLPPGGFQENSSSSVASCLRKAASSSGLSRDLDHVSIPDVPNVSGKQLSVWQCVFRV